MADEVRLERDSMGEISVAADRYWGAQTQRSLQNFAIGEERMPSELIQALALVKQAAALTNSALGVLDAKKTAAIAQAAEEIRSGMWDEHFPLRVWQTGSGTQTNMNVNEVIAHRGNEILGRQVLHPNDDVNKSQSSNDTFPTAMHVSAVLAVEQRLLPAVDALIAALEQLEAEHSGILKIGRTHLQDATPIYFSQEISGWRAMLQTDRALLLVMLDQLRPLALGGTAVGTGINAPAGFDRAAAEQIAALSGSHFVTAENKYQALTSKAPLAALHGALKALAADMMKIANDIRWLASGPRCGLGEISLPANEPGSSIMPGKVNPTQCEAITMIAVQVMGNDAAVGFAASQGNFQLNVFMPVLIYNVLQSVRLLSDGIDSFTKHCICGIKVNEAVMEQNLNRSLMTVTALAPHIGYDNAAKLAKTAYEENISLKEACLALGFLDEERFDALYRLEEMAGHA